MDLVFTLSLPAGRGAINQEVRIPARSLDNALLSVDILLSDLVNARETFEGVPDAQADARIAELYVFYKGS